MPDSVCGAGGASRRQEYTDVAIIGAGPAGATLARRLAETTNYRVTLLDRRALDRPQQGVGKCCGGLLAPDAQRSLARQGLILPLEILVDPQIFAVRTIDLHLPEERYYSRSYLNMDREKFDRWLLGLVPPEVRVHTDAVCRGVHRIGGSYAVDYQQGGEACRLYARCVVGADGGGSLVRRSLYGTHEIARYVAVQEWYADDSGSPFYGALFDEELTDCYGWLISKNDRLVLGAAFPQDNAARRFACLKRRLQKRGFVFGERVRREGCIVCRPTGPKSFCTGRDGAFLVGEAAGFISPSSLEGISYALDSGALLAKALLPGIAGAGRRYAQLTAGLRLRLLGKLMKNPFLYQPVIRETILESGLASLLVLSAAGRTASRPEAAAPDTGAAPGCTAQRR